MHWDAWQSTYNVNHQVSVASALIIYGKVRSCSYFHEHSVEKYTTQIWKLYRKLNFPTFFDCLPFTSCKRRQLLILSEGAIAGVIERFGESSWWCTSISRHVHGIWTKIFLCVKMIKRNAVKISIAFVINTKWFELKKFIQKSYIRQNGGKLIKHQAPNHKTVLDLRWLFTRRVLQFMSLRHNILKVIFYQKMIFHLICVHSYLSYVTSSSSNYFILI